MAFKVGETVEIPNQVEYTGGTIQRFLPDKEYPLITGVVVKINRARQYEHLFGVNCCLVDLDKIRKVA